MQRNDVERVAPKAAHSESTRTLYEALFSPHAVAVIGQSNDAAKTAGRPLKFLRRAGFEGRIYPVNAYRQEVLGERAWPSLEALPEVPEHVYIITAADAAMSALEACGKAGVAVATVLTDGFAEAGSAGAAREARLAEIVAATGMRVVGPSSLGIVNLRNGMMLTANAAFDELHLPVGRIFAASHSGGMIGTLVSRGKACGVGFASLVSVGNEVDLSLGDLCVASLEDAEIAGYVLFLETMRHADRLHLFAERAALAGKPVLAYKLGRSQEARELAATHTGALAGDDEAADAFLRDCGIARVHTLSALIEGLPLLARVPAMPVRRGRQVAVVTTTAGGAATIVDALAGCGVEAVPPRPATQGLLAAAGINAAAARLIDLTLAGVRYDVMKAALGILTTAPEFEMVIVVVGSSAQFYPELAVQPIIDTARQGAGKPVAVFLVPEAPQARVALGRAGIANFYTPEACADAVAAALGRRPPRISAAPAAARVVPHRAQSTGEASRGAPARTLDELQSYAVLDRLGIAHAPALAFDIDALPPTLPFPSPVAVKAVSQEISHKSDLGGVALAIADAGMMRAAVAAMRGRIADLRRVLVQPMVAGIGEALIGYRVDPQVGPLVMVAAGGIFAEIYRDRSLRLAPVDLGTAGEMIAEVRAFTTLGGYRGRPAGDIAALAAAIVALSRLVEDPAVVEADVNPLMVCAQGAVAVDALVRMR